MGSVTPSRPKVPRLDTLAIASLLDLLPEGAAIFDAQERFVTANPAFLALFPDTVPFMKQGVRFEELLRAGIEAKVNLPARDRDMEEYIAERMLSFRYPTEMPTEFRLSDGRWIAVQDKRMPDGGTLCLRTDITALKRREAELRDSERRYRQLVDLTPDGIGVHDIQGRGRFLNAAGRNMLGLTADEPVIGLPILDFTTEESRALGDMMIRRAAAGESLRGVRMELKTRNGGLIVISLSALPFESAGERLVLCLFRDITSETAANLRLRESEARARSILDTAMDCIIAINDAGEVLEFNPAAERTFGWSRADALGRPLATLIFSPDPETDQSSGMFGMDDTALSGLLGRRVEMEAVRRDGTRFPVELAMTAVPLGPGRRYTVHLRDITERKQAEHEIWEKTRILDSMMDNVGIGIEVYGADGRLLLANRRVGELLGVAPEILVPGLLDRDLVRILAEQGEYPGETVEESLADYERLRYDKGGVYFNERQRPNGTWLQVRHFPMPGGGFVSLFSDITEQRRLEAQLLQAQKMEALGQLAGGIAHDFNNILSVIGGYAALARQGVEKESIFAGYLGKIVQGVERAAALTRELLTFSRQKAGGAVTIDLGAVVRGQEFMLKPLLGATISLSVSVPGEPVWVAIDPDMAAQALVNLAINGRDAMPGGGPLTVELVQFRADDPERPPPPAGFTADDYALLRVSDAGAGIPAELLERIFDPFFTTKPPGEGTGLGLAMVYGTVKQANGVIQVESPTGRGTCFSIWLPLAPAPANYPDPAVGRALPADCDRATILVAEDEPDLLTIVSQVLEGAGHVVRTAADGVEALERFEEGGVDLLLTDLVMPNLGGVRLAHLVTALAPDVVVLFMTGYPGRHHAAIMDLPPDIPVLYKPIDPDTLLAAVADALASSRTSG